MHTSIKTVALFLSLLIFTACAGVPLKTLVQLRNLSPLETDLGKIHIAVVSGRALNLSEDAASLRLAYHTTPTHHSIDEHFSATVRVAHPAEFTQFVVGPRQKVTLFSFDPSTAETLRTAQNQIRALRAEGIEGKGQLQINITSACFTEVPTPTTMPTDIYIKLDKQAKFMLLQRNIDLIEIAKKANYWKDWQRCSSPAAL